MCKTKVGEKKDKILKNVEEINKDVADMKKRITHIEKFEKDVTNRKKSLVYFNGIFEIQKTT